jgi:hypothetical protein
MTIWQTYFDAIDPVNYDPLIVKTPPAGVASKHVFMPWGQDDTYSPASKPNALDSTLSITARTMGLQLAAPQLVSIGLGAAINRPVSLNRNGGDGQARTAACFQYAPDGYDGHFVSTQNPAAVVDWAAFLTSAAATGTPTVPMQ